MAKKGCEKCGHVPETKASARESSRGRGPGPGATYFAPHGSVYLYDSQSQTRGDSTPRNNV